MLTNSETFTKPSKTNLSSTFFFEIRNELISNILPYWMNKMVDVEQGGYYGKRAGDDILVKDAPKSAILHARILWTFSAAYRVFNSPEYLQYAQIARDYIYSHFWDKKNGGIYWSLNADGTPLENKKQFYALGFVVYGLTEYHRATGDFESLEKSIELYNLIEKYSFDNVQNGYIEACTDDWQILEDVRLSLKDKNEKKTMNTHLHILEPYTNLYRIWKTPVLRFKLKNLINIFLDKIIDQQTYHLGLFFDEKWNPGSKIISYGHDIEAVWLLHEAAIVLDDAVILEKVRSVIPFVADAAAEGLQKDGSLIYENNLELNHLDKERHWWGQAEAIVGFFDIWQLTNDTKYLENVKKLWKYIQSNLVDKENGEWFWSIKDNGEVNDCEDKAGFWKCPYHNGRMCIELIERFLKEKI